MYQLIEQMTVLFRETLDRCEHCGREGDVFHCDPCQNAKAELLGIVSDILTQVGKNPETDTLFCLRIVAILEHEAPLSL